MLTKLSLSADFTSFLTRYLISAKVKEEEGAKGLSSPVYLAYIVPPQKSRDNA